MTKIMTDEVFMIESNFSLNKVKHDLIFWRNDIKVQLFQFNSKWYYDSM